MKPKAFLSTDRKDWLYNQNDSTTVEIATKILF